jgi:putative membrane protein
MQNNVSNLKEKNLNWIIWLISILIPIIVFILYFVKIDIQGLDTRLLPKINAFLNGTTTIVLILALIAIKSKKIKCHRMLMFVAIGLSTLFLVSYVLYHLSSDPTKFGGEGAIRYIYFFILITHIILAAAIVPLVLITFIRALSNKFDKHKKIAKITMPLWLYVTSTGVIVYLLMSPYYG